jgi:hypothetical protein
LPFGHGRQFALHGPLNQVAGGWRVSTLFQWHGGVPFTPVIQSSVASGIDPGLAPSLSAGSTLYPELVGNPSSHHTAIALSSSQHPGISGWFNPAAFANPALGTFGSNGRNTLIGPGFTDVDISIAKQFPIREAIALEIKADMSNAFNHVNYANPDADVGYSGGALADSTAGTITGPAGGNGNMRIIQLGAHLRF